MSYLAFYRLIGTNGLANVEYNGAICFGAIKQRSLSNRIKYINLFHTSAEWVTKGDKDYLERVNKIVRVEYIIQGEEVYIPTNQPGHSILLWLAWIRLPYKAGYNGYHNHWLSTFKKVCELIEARKSALNPCYIMNLISGPVSDHQHVLFDKYRYYNEHWPVRVYSARVGDFFNHETLDIRGPSMVATNGYRAGWDRRYRRARRILKTNGKGRSVLSFIPCNKYTGTYVSRQQFLSIVNDLCDEAEKVTSKCLEELATM